MGLDPARIAALLKAAETASTTDAQGKAYEDLSEYLFTQVPGCLVERNLTNPFGAEQVDLAVGNFRLPHGLPLLASVILVECKDWSQPVDSKTLGYFINICASRYVEVGILIAANGITGDAGDRSYAHSLGMSAPRAVKVLVITTDEIAGLVTTKDLIDLLNRRYLRAFASNAIGFPDP